MSMKRWKLVDGHVEFDGVGIFALSPVQWGSFTPERVVELLNQVTVTGEVCSARKKSVEPYTEYD